MKRHARNYWREKGLGSNPWGSELSTRLLNVLANVGIKSKEEAIEAVTDGILCQRSKWPRNYGQISHRELCTALGVENMLRTKRCSYCGSILPE